MNNDVTMSPRTTRRNSSVIATAYVAESATNGNEAQHCLIEMPANEGSLGSRTRALRAIHVLAQDADHPERRLFGDDSSRVPAYSLLLRHSAELRPVPGWGTWLRSFVNKNAGNYNHITAPRRNHTTMRSAIQPSHCWAISIRP